MNDVKPTNNGNKSRRTLVRAALLVVYAAIMMAAFIFGKGHTILLDNKDSEDGSIKAFENVTVSVDGQEPMEFASGDRDMAKVHSQWHTVKLVSNGQTTEKKITVPIGTDMLLLSIPKLAAGVEPAVIPFVPKDQPKPADDSAGNNNSFTSPGGPTDAPVIPGTAPAPVAP